MGKVTIIELSELELIYGGDSHGSIFHPDTWVRYFEYALTHPGKEGISLYVKTIHLRIQEKFYHNVKFL